MIETVESVKNFKEILADEHLDIVYVDSYDLSFNQGYSPDKVFTEQSMLDLYEFILNKTLKYKKKQLFIVKVQNRQILSTERFFNVNHKH